MDGQDWNTVVIHKKKTKKDKTHDGPTVLQKRVTFPTFSKKILESDEIHAQEHVSKSMSDQIKTARNAMRKPDGSIVTQSDLNNMCAFPPNTIRDFENGTAVPDPNKVNKLSKILKVQLKK
jgi:ribosome-binding protein aMBF1 (putative translation factor)